MLFNSVSFFIFFAVVYTLYRIFPFRLQNWLLLIAGYIFYGAWDVRFLFLIAFSTTVDFWIGLLMADGKVPRRERLIASLFIVLAAFAFLNIDWAPLLGGDLRLQLTNSTIGRWTLAGTIAVVLLANALHPHVARLEEARRKRVMVVISVAVNLGFLAIFKYFNFFVDSFAPLLDHIGLGADRYVLNVILPVGISFYTFQSLSYTIDVSRGAMRPVHRFFDFALFVAFFPPMVAGPIERARHLLPQLQHPRTIRLRQSMEGVVLILFGLFKKIAIADGLAPAVNAVYGSSAPASGLDVAYATVLFAFQILCDFSGYSDIARGVSKLLGIEIMVNFDLPYFSRNPSEFWRRWHISLSSWLRDYLYIPLGGNRKGSVRTYVNLLTTMTLGGLWHGAAANFILWGFYQGTLLSVHRAATGKRHSLPSGKAAVTNHAPGRYAYLPAHAITVASIAVMFLFVCYGWLLFRASSFAQVRDFTLALAGKGPNVASMLPKPPLSAIVGLVVLILIQLTDYRSGRSESFRFWPRPAQGLLFAVMLFILAMGLSNAPAQFIYFQF